jgi:hypothetical protein
MADQPVVAVPSTPTPLTFADIKKADRDQIHDFMKNRRPEFEEAIRAENERLAGLIDAENEAYKKEQEVKAEHEARLVEEANEAAKSPEQKAEEAAALAAVEAERVVQEKAAADEAARIEAEKVAQAEEERKDLEEKQRLAEEAAKPKQKIVREYQVKDEKGNPIGRPTHLEADTWEEMAEKMEAAHANAVRFAERMKRRAELKPTFSPPEPKIEVLDEPEILAIQKDLESKDELVVAKAKAALELNAARRDRLELRKREDFVRGQAVSLTFRDQHPEFNACEANSKVLSQYIRDNQLEWTLDNLEIAYAATESQLAPRTVEIPSRTIAVSEPVAVPVVQEIKQEPPVTNTPVAAPVVAQPPASAAAVAPTPVDPPAPTPNVAAQERKTPAAGIEPGTLHGARPTGPVASKPTGLTKQDIAKMPRDEYRKRMRDPGFVRMVNALFAAK